MKQIDLTHVIRPGMPVYPGTESPLFEVGSSMEEHGFREKRITMFSHTGTHMDAPAHILPGGKTLDQFPVETFRGRGCVVDVREVGAWIEVGHLESLGDAIRGSDFVLLWSGWDDKWGAPEYFEGFPVLTPEAARWLVATELKGVGLDMISVDATGSEDFPVHKILLGAEIVLVENLTGIEALPPSGFEFSCHPLLLEEADGAPVRAVATVG